MSLVNTRLQNFRADSPVDKWEVRASNYGFLDLFQSQTNSPTGIITDDLKQKAIAAVGSTLEIPVIDKEGFTIQNVTQPLVIAGDPSTSQLYAVTFVNYYFGFRMFPAAHMNNEIKLQREFNRKLQGYIYSLLASLDQAGAAALEADKTQVLADDLGGRYALTADVVVAPLAEEGAIIGDINPLFTGNDFMGPVHVVGNPSFESHVRNKLLEKGQYNTENKTYQWADKTFHFSNNLSNAVGHKATFFAVQGDAVGMVQQFSPDAILGHSTHNHVWDIETLPIANIPIGVYQYDDAINGATLNGAASAHLTATKMEAYGFHTAVAFITPYNSDPTTNASSIMKGAIATI